MIKTTAHTYRNAYAGLSRETWLLSLIMLINRSGTMVVPFMTLYLTSPEMGFSVSQAGVVFGLFGAGAFIGAWLGGKFTDKIGFYPVQLVSLSVGGILFILLGQMHTYPLICLFTFLLSFANEAVRPANSTAIAFYSKEENRTRSYALNRLAINLGWAVGSTMGGFLAHINYELLFWVDGATNIVAVLLLWFLLRPVRYTAPVKQKTVEEKRIPAYRDRTFMRFVVITMFFASCFFQLFNNLPLFFEKELHLTTPFIGVLMATNGIIIALVEMVLIYKLEGRRQHIFYIRTGVTLVGLSFLLITLPGNGAILASCMIVLVTLGEILSMPFMNSYWIGRSLPANRGQYAAIYTMAWSAAQTFGPMGGAFLADNAGFRVLWWSIGGMCLLEALAFRQLGKKR